MNAQDIEVGDFITIPAWKVRGQVTAILSDYDPFATDTSVSVRVQYQPEGREYRFRLEPGEWHHV